MATVYLQSTTQSYTFKLEKTSIFKLNVLLTEEPRYDTTLIEPSSVFWRLTSDQPCVLLVYVYKRKACTQATYILPSTACKRV